jgi:acetyl-CoA synthetase
LAVFEPQHRIPESVSAQVELLLSRNNDPLVTWQNCVSLLRGYGTPREWAAVWKQCFAEWEPTELGPAPMWLPEVSDLANSNLARWMREKKVADFPAFHRWTAGHREQFWLEAIQRLEIKFQSPPTKIADFSSGLETPNWLPDARLNIAESCFQADESKTAIVFGSADQVLQCWTYGELRTRTLAVAAAVRQAGFQPGDALAVVLPMTADSIAIYLGIIWAGCAVVSIADSFAPREIASRLRIANAKGVFTYDEMIRSGKQLPLYAKVVEATELPIVVLKNRSETAAVLRPVDSFFDQFLSRGAATPDSRAHHAQASEVINILFSSGTTGDPKAIPWTHTTPIRCAIDGFCHQDIRPEYVTCWPTNLGWMMGPFLIFATLINRATMALYEDAPVGPGFGAFVQYAQVNVLGVIPTLVRTWRASGDLEKFDWSRIHVFSSTGESSQADDMFYLSSLAGMRPVIEYCGGTEIGGGYISATVVQPNYAGTFTTPTVGLDFVILDEEAKPANVGELFIVPPSIGLSTRLLNRDHHETYYADVPKSLEGPLLRRHGDHFRRLPGNLYVAGGRVDDTMNLGGIKVSSAELERVMNEVGGVRETAAIALASQGGPEELFVFAVCSRPQNPEALLKELNHRLRTELNPLFKVKEVRIVDSLPRTASNKVMRRKLRDHLVGKD